MAKRGGQRYGDMGLVPVQNEKFGPHATAGEETVPVPLDRWDVRPRKNDMQEFEFGEERFRAEGNGAGAETGFLFRATESKLRYGMEYETKDGIYRFTYLVDGEPGRIVAIVPGEEHTVVFSEDRAVLVMGWKAAERGDEWITVDGGEVRDARAISFELDSRFRGENFLSVAAAHNNGMTCMFMINRDGVLGARGWSMERVPYAEKQFAPSEGWQLLSAGSVAILVQEGSANAYVLSADFSGAPRINMHTIILPEAVRGRAEIRNAGGRYAILHGGGEMEISGEDLAPPQQ
ncbi:MAG: hypothetical protein PHY95_00325 [Candidatus ainarchaeum sp.]|nr:hypothetical protein [Candidatus ainarchaeum sp.]